jgi:type IV secretory pathway VirD2 relaxase
MVGLEAERSLRDLGMRGDIIKTMHRAFTERGKRAASPTSSSRVDSRRLSLWDDWSSVDCMTN